MLNKLYDKKKTLQYKESHIILNPYPTNVENRVSS